MGDAKIGTVRPDLAGPNNAQFTYRVIKMCSTCLAPVSCRPSEIKWRKYCSANCRYQGLRQLTGRTRYNFKGGPYPMACEICGTVKMVAYGYRERFRACSKRCAGAIGSLGAARTSSLEVAMLRAFALATVVVEPQYQVGYWVVDFAIPDEHLVIECDGIYWHSLPKQIVRDRQKDDWLASHGWSIIRLTEAEIRADPDECAHRVGHLLGLATEKRDNDQSTSWVE